MREQFEFRDHSEPVWRDRSNFIIHATLPETGYYEQLWARQISSSKFEVCCIPFFLYDIALGDTVLTEISDDQMHLVKTVSERSGRFVFRAYFADGDLAQQNPFEDMLTSVGALLERSSSQLLAIDGRDMEHAEQISNLLQTWEDAGSLQYETGKR